MLPSLQNKMELKCKHRVLQDNVSLLLAVSIDDFPLDKQAAYPKINISEYHFVQTCSGYYLKKYR